MTPKEIVVKFSHSLDNFKPIDGKPSDSDLTRLREAVTPLLIQIPYDETGAVHNLICLIRPEAALSLDTARRSPSLQESGPTIKKLRTRLRLSSVRAPKRHTKPSARPALHMKWRDGRQLNSCLPSSHTPGSASYETQTRSTPRFPRRTSFPTSKRGAPAGTP